MHQIIIHNLLKMQIQLGLCHLQHCHLLYETQPSNHAKKEGCEPEQQLKRNCLIPLKLMPVISFLFMICSGGYNQILTMPLPQSKQWVYQNCSFVVLVLLLCMEEYRWVVHVDTYMERKKKKKDKMTVKIFMVGTGTWINVFLYCI